MTKISVSLSIEESLVSRIDKIAASEDVRRSWLVQKVMAGWVERYAVAQGRPPQPEATASGVGRRPEPQEVGGAHDDRA